MTTLSRLARVKGRDKPSVLLTTVNAVSQRVPARDFTATHALSVAPGNVLGDGRRGLNWLELNGFMRASTGARARRLCRPRRHPRSVSAGPGHAGALRFLRRLAGDDQDVRSADPAQRDDTLGRSICVPVAEFQLITETIRRFRTGYVAQFGAAIAR